MVSYRLIKCIRCNIEKKQATHCKGKYCSAKCQAMDTSDRVITSWLSGEDKGWTGQTVQLKNAVKRYLLETRGAKCEECGWDKLHPIDGKPLIEIDHIDGDAKNNRPENLKILCPNCHAMTPTFRARNKVSSRKR